MSSFQLARVSTEREYSSCFELMRELRPHLSDPRAFVQQVKRQTEQGYRLLAAWAGDEVIALTGYRLTENLMYGRFMYVDDLVVGAGERHRGLGGRLIGAVRREARLAGCRYLVLDTGLGMALAQRFYFRQGLLSRGMHFCEALTPSDSDR